MIVVEERMMELFSQLPQTTSNGITYPKPVYHFGDDLELNKFILGKQEAQELVYPLIYQTSFEETQYPFESEVETRLEMFIAYKTETDLYNTQRWATSYRNILMPTFENIHTAFVKGNIVQSEFQYDVRKFPNYGADERNSTEHKTVDIIDAVRFRLNCRINNRCINKNILF